MDLKLAKALRELKESWDNLGAEAHRSGYLPSSTIHGNENWQLAVISVWGKVGMLAALMDEMESETKPNLISISLADTEDSGLCPGGFAGCRTVTHLVNSSFCRTCRERLDPSNR